MATEASALLAKQEQQLSSLKEENAASSTSTALPTIVTAARPAPSPTIDMARPSALSTNVKPETLSDLEFLKAAGTIYSEATAQYTTNMEHLTAQLDALHFDSMLAAKTLLTAGGIKDVRGRLSECQTILVDSERKQRAAVEAVETKVLSLPLTEGQRQGFRATYKVNKKEATRLQSDWYAIQRRECALLNDAVDFVDKVRQVDGAKELNGQLMFVAEDDLEQYKRLLGEVSKAGERHEQIQTEMMQFEERRLARARQSLGQLTPTR